MVNEVKDGDFPAVPPSLPSALLHGYDELPGGISKSDFVGKFLKQRRSEDTGGVSVAFQAESFTFSPELAAQAC